MSVVPSIQRLKIFKKKHNEFGDVVGDKGKSVGEGERKSKSKRKRERERERKRERERECNLGENGNSFVEKFLPEMS